MNEFFPSNVVFELLFAASTAAKQTSSEKKVPVAVICCICDLHYTAQFIHPPLICFDRKWVRAAAHHDAIKNSHETATDCTTRHRICRDKRPARLIFRSNKRHSKTHQKPSVLCTLPFEKSLFLVGAYFGWALTLVWAFISAKTVYCGIFNRKHTDPKSFQPNYMSWNGKC